MDQQVFAVAIDRKRLVGAVVVVFFVVCGRSKALSRCPSQHCPLGGPIGVARPLSCRLAPLALASFAQPDSMRLMNRVHLFECAPACELWLWLNDLYFVSQPALRATKASGSEQTTNERIALPVIIGRGARAIA